MRIGVIGAGRMGLRHVQVARNLGWPVVGVADSNAAALSKAATDFGLDGSHLFESADALFARTRLEGVVIATTAPSHAPLVLQAAAAGVKYILCEKPMAVSIAQGEQMLQACRERGALLAVNHQMRFMEQYTCIKERIDQPQFGGLRSVVVLGSNFGLAMNGTHYFEMFRYLTGQEVASVSAWLDDDDVPNPRGPMFLDKGGQIRGSNRSGQSLLLDCSTSVGHGVQVAYLCRNGQIIVDELSGHVRAIHRKAEFADLPTTRYAMPADEIVTSITPADVIEPTQSVWQSLVSGANFPDGEAGLHAIRCAAAASASHEIGGRPVALSSAELNKNRVFPWA